MRTLFTAAAAAALLGAAPQPRADLLVSTTWLVSNLKTPGLVVLNAAGTRAPYDAGHIPGARLLLMDQIIATRPDGTRGLPPAQVLKSVFERLGVSNSTRVVLYGEPLAASRAFFTLDYLGHRKTAILDGGIEKWRAEGLPVTTAVPAVEPAVFNITPRPWLVVTFDEAKQLSQAAQDPASGVVVIDSRSFPAWRAGHIPGSKNVFWADELDGIGYQTLKPAAELQKMYGLDSPKTVVTYCNTGMQATFGYFTLRYLGYTGVRLYEGSFSEWSRHPEVLIQH